MNKTPVWQIINRLTRSENSDLEKFSSISVLGGTAELNQLLVFLQKKALKNRCPKREDCYKVLFPELPYNATHFRQILHKLTELVRDYLSTKAMSENGVLKNRLLALQLEKLELNTVAQQELIKAEKELETQKGRGPLWHEERFHIKRQFFSNELAGARTRKLDLQDFSDDLERAFILRKLKLACELISHSSVYRSNYDFGLLDAVLEKISESDKLLKQPEIVVYYHCCLALLNPDEGQHFDALKPKLKAIPSIFPPQECRDILLLSLNYCIKKLNQGQLQFAHEGLELYKLALAHDFLLEKGEISRFTFKNAVAMGLKIGAFDWVEGFIKNYHSRLPVKHRESMMSFNLARLSYEKKDYDAALGYLQKADYQDILLTLAAKTLLLKIFYETDELRLLDTSIDSMKIFLRRKKVLAYHKQNYKNIVKYMMRLVALNPMENVEKKALKAAIVEEQTLTEKEWFLEKLEV